MQVNKIDVLKEIIRAWGMNPEQFLTKDVLAEGGARQKSQEAGKPSTDDS